jgi:hypothetical protein
MTPKFLREEAARFRSMAETSDREASKQRFLAMAVDFEGRAQAADEVTDPAPEPAVTEPAVTVPAAPVPAAPVRATRRVTAKEPKEEV